MTAPLRKPSVKLVHGKVTTTSLKIAESFGKRHDNVLRTINNLECSLEFAALNFEASEYTDAAGAKRPMYIITRDGFAFLASGFTGKEAAHWKERFIEAFNHLEQKVLEKATAKQIPQKVLTIPKRYDYPRKRLEQPYFTSKEPASLSMSMLVNTKEFTSQVKALLNELRTDGHNVDAAWDEYQAMIEAVKDANKFLDEVMKSAINAKIIAASTSLRK